MDKSEKQIAQGLVETSLLSLFRSKWDRLFTRNSELILTPAAISINNNNLELQVDLFY